MEKFISFYEKSLQKLISKNINVRVIGEHQNLKDNIISIIEKINNYPFNEENMTFTICFNYGSRQEMIHATKEIVNEVLEGKININDINETLFNSHLYTKLLAPLDLIIRTSGEYRLSNFLLWQASYAELYFTNVLFPDFNEDELYKAILDYQKRDRRFGKIGDK